jgi:hypothetical protein
MAAVSQKQMDIQAGAEAAVDMKLGAGRRFF